MIQNNDNIRSTIALMRRNAEHFDMGSWFYTNGHLIGPLLERINHCGTSACIAGFATLDKMGHEEHEPVGFMEVAAEHFGISPSTASTLFLPVPIQFWLDPEGDLHVGDTTDLHSAIDVGQSADSSSFSGIALTDPEDAIPVLEHLIETGEVQWTKSPAFRQAIASFISTTPAKVHPRVREQYPLAGA